MLRDIKILSDAQNIPGLLSFLGAYVVPGRDQVSLLVLTGHRTEVGASMQRCWGLSS
jgi:hypothetical protein